MAVMLPYNRTAAVEYAARWALLRNPRYGDFTNLGGDCANFISQCLFAGCRVMNDARDTGWYYRSMRDRSPAWSGVFFLHRFLTRTSGAGIAGRAAPLGELEKGDVIFLHDGRRLYHSLLVIVPSADPLIAAHTVDSWMRPLSSYEHAFVRAVHIVGAVGGER